MKSKAKHITIENLTKGNIWTLTEADFSHMIIEGKKKDDFIENETHYMNIIRPVFDIIYLNRDDEKRVEELESLHYEIYSSPNNGQNNAIAIRKSGLISTLKTLSVVSVSLIHTTTKGLLFLTATLSVFRWKITSMQTTLADILMTTMLRSVVSYIISVSSLN